MRLTATSMLVCAGMLSAGNAAVAVESNRVTSPRATVSIVSEMAAIAPGKPFRVALHQQMTPGWHTYWTNPGDAGQPPEATFDLPPGARVGNLVFPAPHRIPYGPLVNFGYENEATFIAEIVPPADIAPGSSFPIDVKAQWLICETICIPEEGTFRLVLPVQQDAAPAPAMRDLFNRAEAALPRAGVLTASASVDGGTARITVGGPGVVPGDVREAFFFPDDWGVLDHAAPQTMSVSADGITLTMARGQGALPGTLTGVVALVDAAGSRGAYLVSAALAQGADASPIGAAPAASAGAGGSGGGAPGNADRGSTTALVQTQTSASLPLWQAVLWAALGGLILNLMPCVFPILALKAMGVARMAGASRAAMRDEGVAYTAGVVLSFTALALLLLALRGAGVAAGWGFQFTSPIFVTAMAWLMLAVGLNLSGVFHVTTQIGGTSALAARGGRLGSFATGGLAVLVATPCTAPFMAAAIGAALTMPPGATLAVFAAMGLGMAAPYLVLAFVPAAGRLLPRPGAWMERLKQILAFPMYGAAVWLAWVVAQQTGPDGVLLVLLGALAVAFAAWAVGTVQHAPAGRLRQGALAAAVVALLGAGALLPSLSRAPAPGAALAASDAWSPERMAGLLREGRPVFVNMTAAWCISCKVNERVALERPAVREAFAKAGITVLKGDWTNGDPRIAAVLQAHGRSGVPLYLYFAKGSTEPVLLPEILTETIVLRTIGSPSV